MMRQGIFQKILNSKNNFVPIPMLIINQNVIKYIQAVKFQFSSIKAEI